MLEPMITLQPKMPTKWCQKLCKRLNINIIVSKTVSCGDDLDIKGKAVNKCKSNNVWFLDNTNIIPGTHLNRCKLHLNQKETALSASNSIFLNAFDLKIKMRWSMLMLPFQKEILVLTVMENQKICKIKMNQELLQ